MVFLIGVIGGLSVVRFTLCKAALLRRASWPFAAEQRDDCGAVLASSSSPVRTLKLMIESVCPCTPDGLRNPLYWEISCPDSHVPTLLVISAGIQ
jgi:hypothetical protein